MKLRNNKPSEDNAKGKLKTPLSGKIRKSLGNVSGKKNSSISLKNAGQAVTGLDPSEIKIKKKDRMSLLPGVLENMTNKKEAPKKGQRNDQKSPTQVSKLSKKAKKKAMNMSINSNSESELNETPVSNSKFKAESKLKGLAEKKTLSPQENNTSPIKGNKETKKAKPIVSNFSIDASIKVNKQTKKAKPTVSNLSIDEPTPKAQTEKTNKQAGNSSPEMVLGLKLEEALSPKSKKEKKKRLLQEKLQATGKSEVSKKVNVETDKSDSSPVDSEKAGKKKKRRRKRKQHQVNEIPDLPFFQDVNVKNALSALLKTLKTSKSERKDLLDDGQYIYLQVNLFKSTPAAKGVLHIPVPNLILPDPPDVCLITPDMKGKRNDPDEAIDFYKDLLQKNKIEFISEIIPLRKLKMEYTQFEERTKLANRFDAILVEGRINKLARIGRRFAKTKKCVSSVKLDSKTLKPEFERAVRRVALFSSGGGNSHSIKCGRIGMSENDICENIITIGKALANDKIIVGNKDNISSVYVKAAASKSFPIYVSTVSPNEVEPPKGKEHKKEKPVKGEVTTVQGAEVIVYPSGTVKVKKRKNEAVESDDEEEPNTKGAKKAKATLKNNIQKKLKEINESDESSVDESSEESSPTRNGRDELQDVAADELFSSEEEETETDDESALDELGSDLSDLSEGDMTDSESDSDQLEQIKVGKQAQKGKKPIAASPVGEKKKFQNKFDKNKGNLAKKDMSPKPPQGKNKFDKNKGNLAKNNSQKSPQGKKNNFNKKGNPAKNNSLKSPQGKGAFVKGQSFNQKKNNMKNKK